MNTLPTSSAYWAISPVRLMCLQVKISTQKDLRGEHSSFGRLRAVLVSLLADLYCKPQLTALLLSRWEQTDEYAPPEAIFGSKYQESVIAPSFDSWSIGIVALELLLGTPNVFSVDQRTRYVV